MVVASTALLVVIGAGPGGEADRLVRIFVKRLLEELRTGQAVMHPEGFAAAFGHGRDAGVGLELGRRVPARAVGPEGGRQAGRADSPGAGETREQRVIRVGGEDGGDLGIEGVDGLEQGTKLGGVALDHQTQRVDDGRVGGERLRAISASRLSITAARRQLCC